MSTIKDYLKEFMKNFSENDVTLLAASQAYYYLLSIFPLLIVCFAIIPYFNLDPNEVMNMAEQYLPGGMASTLEENIISLIETPKGGLLTVGIIGALWSASGGVSAFIQSANKAYEVEESRSFIVVKLIALSLTIGLILSLGIALLLPIFGNVIVKYINIFLNLGGATTILLQVLRWCISIVVLTGLLIVLYHVAPNKNLPFKHILPGAIAASVLWQLISYGFSFYVDNFGNYSATYGSLGGIIILMMWFYLTGIILMVGAIINVMYHQKQRNLEKGEPSYNQLKKSGEA